MFGYLNLALTGPDRADAEARLEEFASSYGGSVRGRIFCEAGSAVLPLWSLIRAVDHDLGGEVLPRLYAAATRRTLSLDRLLGSAAPTPALWSLLDALANSGGGYLLVPSVAHFDHLGVPKHLLLHRISGLPSKVDVLFLDTSLGGRSEPDLLAEIEVPAFTLAEEVVLISLRQRLARAGLGDLVEPIGQLVHELVGAELDNTAADLVSAHNSIRVRVLCPPESTTVTIEVFESREYADEPIGEAVMRICASQGGNAQRSPAPGGGTITRCELLLPGVEQSLAKLSGLLHQYVDDHHNGWTPPDWVSAALGGR